MAALTCVFAVYSYRCILYFIFLFCRLWLPLHFVFHTFVLHIMVAFGLSFADLGCLDFCFVYSIHNMVAFAFYICVLQIMIAFAKIRDEIKLAVEGWMEERAPKKRL